MTEPDAKATVAAYFEAQARRRGESAAERPDDVRERRSARGILDVADYVRELPQDDPRLERIATLSVEMRPEPGATLVVEAAADEIAYGFRYDDPLESPDALLDRFAAAVETGASLSYAEGRTPGEIAEDLGSEHPTRALLAVRYFAEHLDGWEAGAVSSARTAGWSWERIASVLGRTRQSVWSKHRETEHSSPITRAPRAVAAAAKAAITRVPLGRSHADEPGLVAESETGATDVSLDLAPATMQGLPEGGAA